MRRWMIVLTIAGSFVALLAAPGAARKDTPKDIPVYGVGEGTTTFGVLEVWTGKWAGDTAPSPWPFGDPAEGASIAGIDDWTALMDPTYNRCTVVAATLTWTGENTALLTTVEQCPLFKPLMPRIHTRPVHISPRGAVKLGADPVPFIPNDPETGDHWLVRASGCGLNGTFPVYHGTFDFETGHLYAESHFHGICDGGVKWGLLYGIGKEDGPMHATFTIDVTFDVTPDD